MKPSTNYNQIILIANKIACDLLIYALYEPMKQYNGLFALQIGKHACDFYNDKSNFGTAACTMNLPLKVWHCMEIFPICVPCFETCRHCVNPPSNSKHFSLNLHVQGMSNFCHILTEIQVPN